MTLTSQAHCRTKPSKRNSDAYLLRVWMLAMEQPSRLPTFLSIKWKRTISRLREAGRWLGSMEPDRRAGQSVRTKTPPLCRTYSAISRFLLCSRRTPSARLRLSKPCTRSMLKGHASALTASSRQRLIIYRARTPRHLHSPAASKERPSSMKCAQGARQRRNSKSCLF